MGRAPHVDTGPGAQTEPRAPGDTTPLSPEFCRGIPGRSPPPTGDRLRDPYRLRSRRDVGPFPGAPLRPGETERNRAARSVGATCRPEIKAQCFLSRVSRSAWAAASALALRSPRFSLMDLPDFFDIECRGDLSAIACSLIREPERLRSWTLRHPTAPLLRAEGIRRRKAQAAGRFEASKSWMPSRDGRSPGGTCAPATASW